MRRLKRMVAGLLVLGAVGCGSSEPAWSPTVAPGPALVVERFLQAVNQGDLVTMMQLFGTADQTIDQLDGRAKAERRMHVLASLLRHDDFAIIGQEALPGRIRNAVQLQVQLRQGSDITVVPYVVVRKSSGGWIIERIDVEELTAQ